MNPVVFGFDVVAGDDKCSCSNLKWKENGGRSAGKMIMTMLLAIWAKFDLQARQLRSQPFRK